MSAQARSWGAAILHDGRVRFRLWAPACQQVQLHVEGSPDQLMHALDGGWHELVTKVAVGSLYAYRLPGGEVVADPASFFQPHGVRGSSELVDLNGHQWTQQARQPRPWTEAVIYELHVGTFTPEGTFRAAMRKLPHLVALGITAIELMPVATFAGTRNWGYDGVFPYAPSPAYGRPEDLQALVDAAHGAGIMVLLDVVYNHFGPEGNMLGLYAPSFFTERHHTPWGAGINFDGEQAVRRFFIDNALHWLAAYRLDGLRLDAVHAIADDSPQHIVDAIGAAVRERYPQQPVHLVLENEHNEAHRLARRATAPVSFTAQWNDDLHHVLHVAITDEAAGYYGDYHGDSDKLGRALAQGFAFQGEMMQYRGSPRGEVSKYLPPTAFVSFIQNHDQIGNRAFGERLTSLAPPDAMRAAAAVYLLLPQIPMLFMGEEWGSDQPFPFFCDFDGELGQAVTKGRREEFAAFPEFASPSRRARIPDPLDLETFGSATLRWGSIDEPAHRQVLQWYTRVIAIRHREIIPRLPQIRSAGQYEVMPSGIVRVIWPADDGILTLVANLTARSAPQIPPPNRVLWLEGKWSGDVMEPWCVHWSLGAAY